ncbi:MAG: tetratricopeptide repeat protein [Pseudomonadota bacterium]
MEQKHREHHKRIALMGYQKLLHAGYAGTLNNLAELFHTANRLQDAEELYGQALRERMGFMGKNDFGVVIIRKNIASLPGVEQYRPNQTSNPSKKSSKTSSFISKATQQGWIVDRPAVFTDEGRLMAAILLTCLVDHSHLCSPR